MVTSKCQQRGTQHEVRVAHLRDSNTSRGSTTLRMSPTETLATQQHTWYDEQNFVRIRQLWSRLSRGIDHGNRNADTSLTRSSKTTIGLGTVPAARLHNVKLVKASNNAPMSKCGTPCNTCETVKKGVKKNSLFPVPSHLRLEPKRNVHLSKRASFCGKSASPTN